MVLTERIVTTADTNSRHKQQLIKQQVIQTTADTKTV